MGIAADFIHYIRAPAQAYIFSLPQMDFLQALNATPHKARLTALH